MAWVWYAGTAGRVGGWGLDRTGMAMSLGWGRGCQQCGGVKAGYGTRGNGGPLRAASRCTMRLSVVHVGRELSSGRCSTACTAVCCTARYGGTSHSMTSEPAAPTCADPHLACTGSPAWTTTQPLTHQSRRVTRIWSSVAVYCCCPSLNIQPHPPGLLRPQQGGRRQHRHRADQRSVRQAGTGCPHPRTPTGPAC